MWLWCLFTFVALLLYYHLSRVYDYWNARGVPTATPCHFGVGSLLETLVLRKNVGMIITELYKYGGGFNARRNYQVFHVFHRGIDWALLPIVLNEHSAKHTAVVTPYCIIKLIIKYKGYNYVGYFNYTRPALILRDPELIKCVLISDFNSFHDNDIAESTEEDIFGENPFVKRGAEWRHARAQLTPSFTAGRMKEMFPLLAANCSKLAAYVMQRNDAAIEAKELASRFTGENVASCAFGLEGRCFEQTDAKFYMIGKSLMEPSVRNSLKTILMFFLPFLARIFSVSFFSKEAETFLRNIVDQTVAYRQANNVRRGDFLDAMLDLAQKTNDPKAFNNRHILSHAAGFFGDGFETSAVVISFTLYELAAHPEVQEKLRDEIARVRTQHNDGELSYDVVQDCEYLECVIKENLRKNSPMFALHKRCTERYKLPPPVPGAEATYIDPGTSIVIPAHGLHHDAQFFPDPHRFQPERFAKENAGAIAKCTWVPFGEGPRQCLGNKFGMLQAKMGVLTIVERFRISVARQTQEPIRYDPMAFMIVAQGGLWLNFEQI